MGKGHGRAGSGQRGGRGGESRGRRGGDARGVRVTPVTQARADKLIAKVVQPLGRHYNGQGCVHFVLSLSHT